MQRKDVPLEVKAADGEAGEFSALASVFNNIDSVGDKMLPGSFTRTLERWRQSGNPIPVILSHSWDDPMAHIGAADPHQVVETDRGLEVQGRLDVHDNPIARQVHKLMKERRLTGWSFGYTVPEGGQARKNRVNEVREVDLIEVGPTLRGANAEAQLQAVKAAIQEANYDTDVPALDTGWDEEFRASKKRWDEIWRQREERARKERRLEQLIEEVTTREAKAARAARPIQIKRFEV